MERAFISAKVTVECDYEAIEIFKTRVRDLIHVEKIDPQTYSRYEERAQHALNLSTLNINKKLLIQLGFDIRDVLS